MFHENCRQFFSQVSSQFFCPISSRFLVNFLGNSLANFLANFSGQFSSQFCPIFHCADHFDKTLQTFDPLSGSNAEKRCLLPHPTKMVIPIRRDGDGTHFVCLCCRTEFKLPKMTFYEAGVNSMLTGYCFIGQHTADQDDIGLYPIFHFFCTQFFVPNFFSLFVPNVFSFFCTQHFFHFFTHFFLFFPNSMQEIQGIIKNAYLYRLKYQSEN